MQVKVRFLENLRLEARFDDFQVVTDQPVRYKGDGTAPSPFDYFLASSALCAAYFVKVYCLARNIPTEDIQLIQDNVIDPENRYQQTIRIRAELPESLSEKDRQGIIGSMDRCTVKRVVQNGPGFEIEAVQVLGREAGLLFEEESTENTRTMIPGKDSSLEETIKKMSAQLEALGIKVEIASWRNIVPHVWSVHIRDAESPICFTNGKGSSKNSALCSALGEFLERASTHFFYNDYYLGKELSQSEFVYFKNEKWFPAGPEDTLPNGLLDEHFLKVLDPDQELRASHLLDTNTDASERGICAFPFLRQSDQETVYVPANLVGNIFVSNGMSAGNSIAEARVQSLSEIFERAVKKQIILEELTLPDVPPSVLERFPKIVEGVKKLESQGFPIFVKDASLGGRFPVICVTLMNPKTGGVFASFGAHPRFEVALERSLTELMQGRSFEGLNDIPPPTWNECAIQEPNNIVEHFVDSTGVISWKFFSQKNDFDFVDWNFVGSTEEEFEHLMGILHALEKEVYIADYDDLGVNACRILVPGYSEIYDPCDLVWDNTNKALLFRSDILNLHHLDDSSLRRLLTNLEESQLDDYMPIMELIGVAFDENSPWGKCTIGELKGLIYLALGDQEAARDWVKMFIEYNQNTPDRRKFYQALEVVLDIELRPSQCLQDFLPSLVRMFGAEVVERAVHTASGELRFHGLDRTNSDLEGIDKHQRLIQSFKKLRQWRERIE